eukprot:GFKZ01006814.1.p1 GENE.GFKZ01006814.1~~GFKZ01006814.1.p1  ORF type:complete len:409 (-),score=28.75 GFKZ01006814.1:111-1337(-)
MVSIEISLASEIVSLLNFLIIDIVLLAYITHISGLLAGHTNHHILNSKGTLHLSTFDAPLIGGGLVTARGPRRTVLILLRLSVVVAAAACNFGLEGRSRPSFVSAMATVRHPGPLLNDQGTAPVSGDVLNVVQSATVLRMNCFQLSENDLTYGDVFNNSCYPGLQSSVFIHKLSLTSMPVPTRATECVAEQDCGTFRTIFRCRETDMVCTGFERPQECPCVGSDDQCQGAQPQLQTSNCVAVVYAENGAEGWICDREKVYPNKTEGKNFCMRFEAQRKHVEDWVRFYLSVTPDHVKTLFAAAYGQPRRQQVRVPTTEERAVTVVNLYWFASVGWMVVVTAGLSMWRITHIWQGTPIFAHDESGLARLLDRQIGKAYGRTEGGDRVAGDDEHETSGERRASKSTVVLRK